MIALMDMKNRGPLHEWPGQEKGVGQAYLRAISNPFTGRILKLHKTDF